MTTRAPRAPRWTRHAMVRLSDDAYAHLEARANNLERTPSALIREAVARFLAGAPAALEEIPTVINGGTE